MQLKKTKKTNYKSEYMDTLSTLMNDNSHLKSFRYFLDTAFVWMDQEYRKKEAPQVVVLGPGVPEELLWAAGAKPYWILGGSLGACAWADDLLPRDTDPVSRSVMGFLHEREGLDMSETLFIVPVYCDSMRKIAYLLKEEGKNVLAVDFPPEKDHSQSSFSDVAHECTEVYEMMAEAQEKELRLQLEENLFIKGDETTIRQLLTILCENALKYGKDEIYISLYGEGKKVIFETVNAWDRSVKAENLDQLFERFFRGDVSRNRDGSKSGYGLGLSIAKSIVLKNHGNLEVYEDKNQRLVFRVSFRRCAHKENTL